MKNNLRFFKEILVIFWAVWWTTTFLTDLLGGMKQIGWLQYSWVTNANYPFLMQSLKLYSAPQWLPPVLFIGIIIWCFLSMLYFWIAVFSSRIIEEHWLRKVNVAFIVSLSLWLTFFIADQIVMDFKLEENHMVQGGFELLTFLCFYILPSHNQKIAK